MLTVIAPATSTDLTTVARAKELLKFPSSDDAAALRLIKQASRVITDHCRRPFALETVREAFPWIQTRGEGPILARSPVVELLSVRSNGDLLPASYCALDDTTGRLRRVDADGAPLPWWGGALVAEYRAGYLLPKDGGEADTITLPEAVERACIILVGIYLSARGRDPSIKAESNDGVGSTSWYVPAVTDRLASPEAAQLLAPYVRFYP